MSNSYLGQLQHQSLKQTLSTQQLQYINLLRMNNQELNSYLEGLNMENPVVELEPPKADIEDVTFDAINLAGWLSSNSTASFDENYDDQDSENNYEHIPHLQQRSVTLWEYLRNQFDLCLGDIDLKLLERLVSSLDANGYLTLSAEALAKEMDVDTELAKAAVDYLRTLDPPGIGGYDLADSLCLQLERRGVNDNVAFAIVKEHLEDCAHGHFQKVAKNIRCDIDKVKSCYSIIRTLDPRPASAFGEETVSYYIFPDVTVEIVEGEPVCIYNKQYNAGISINHGYLKMAEEDTQARQYINQKLSQAVWTIKAIESRRMTIERISDAIVKRQRMFFTELNGELIPMRLCDIANDLDMHESTISRAISDKYLQCRRGIFPIKSFFSGAATTGQGESDLGVSAVKERIRKLIESEQPQSPLSDSALMQKLAESGIMIARRTIAKYREEMGIPSSQARKRSK